MQEIEKKREKAKFYITEPERFEVMDFTVKMNSKHDTRTITYNNGVWKCTCEFFQANEVCSHTIALNKLLSKLTIKNIENDTI